MITYNFIKPNRAQTNLENLICCAFEATAVEIIYNPYEGLKPEAHWVFEWESYS